LNAATLTSATSAEYAAAAMSRRLALLAGVLVCCGTGCAKNQPNPFLAQTLTVVPRPEDSLIFTSNGYATEGGMPREVFSVGPTGDPLRLTICNNVQRTCDSVEAAPSRDHTKLAVRRVSEDTNGDGRLSEADGTSLVLLDLNRSVEGELIPASRSVSGVDWSPAEDLLIYTAATAQAGSDLFSILPNGTSDRPVTTTLDLKERGPRFDPTGFTAVFEGIDSDGKSRIYVLNSPASNRLTAGGPGSELLEGTPYVVGSDADPAYSPDGRQIAFRRLTGTGNGGLGTWDLLIVGYDGSAEHVLASGAIYRGAPDWGPRGIAFVEIDSAANRASLVVLQPDGSGRTALVSGSAFLSNPRWLR
jgi:dipeptidyl aminopeptidase/acylaminoacyl peptidase